MARRMCHKDERNTVLAWDGFGLLAFPLDALVLFEAPESRTSVPLHCCWLQMTVVVVVTRPCRSVVAMKPRQLVSTNRGAKPFHGAYSALNANEDDFRPGDSSQDFEMTMSGSVDTTAPSQPPGPRLTPQRLRLLTSHCA